ncbi:MAG: RNA polymerase sigma factor [Deltaproteobacteria bacterium]|nr:RNA polymerase sigma factor [Deltaproteobacteria bacterium]
MDEFTALVQSSTPRLFRLAARLMGSADEARDVLQDSFIRAHEALQAGRFDGRSGAQTWLYRIVTNSALDALRRRRRRGPPALPRDEDGPSLDGARIADARAALRELREWLADLPLEQRIAIVLKEIEGLTSAEVAAVIGISEGAVEQRLVRARAALRRRMEDESGS